MTVQYEQLRLDFTLRDRRHTPSKGQPARLALARRTTDAGAGWSDDLTWLKRGRQAETLGQQLQARLDALP